jgi:phage-related protein
MGIWGAMWSGVVTAFNAIHTFIATIIRVTLAVIAAVLGNIISVWNAGWNTIHTFLAMIWTRIGSTVSAAIAFGLSIIRGFISGALSAINGLGSIPARVGGFFMAMFNQANTGIQRLLTLMRSVPNSALNALGNLGSILYNAGRNLINGLINGVRNAIGELRGLLNSVTGWIPDWKGPMEKDRRLLEPTGDAIMGGLMRGIRKNIGGLRGLLGSVTTGMPTMAMAGVPGGGSTGTMTAPAPTTNSYGGNNVTVQVNGIAELKEFMDFMNGKSRQSAKSDRWASTIYNENAGYQRGYQ